MKYSKIKSLDISNGTGIRVSLFVSGCPHHCKGCFNPETWDYGYGREYTKIDEANLLWLVGKPYITGLSLLGGEPMVHTIDLIILAQKVKRLHPKKTIWLYTGFKYEDIKDAPILHYIDVLVDGRFEEDKKDLKLRYRGSSNQRIIDVQKSRQQDKVVLMEDY